MLRIVLPVCILIFAVCPVAAAADRPAAALTEIREGIARRDMAPIERRMDFEALLDQGMDTFFELLQRRSASLPPALALMAGAADSPEMRQMLRGLMKSEIRTFIRYGVVSGHFAGKPDPSVRPEGLAAPLLQDVSLGSKTFRTRGTARINGETAVLPAVLHDGGSGREYPLDLRLSLQDGLWRITGLENLPQLTARLRKEAAELR